MVNCNMSLVKKMKTKIRAKKMRMKKIRVKIWAYGPKALQCWINLRGVSAKLNIYKPLSINMLG